MTQQSEVPHVYAAIVAMTHSLAKEGISKDSTNAAQGFKFRGVDAVMNAISPKLAEHQLCILPRVMSKETVERQSNKGTTLFYTTLDVEFDLVSAVDGSKHTVCTIGEAMDSGDKSCAKAMSAAYKYACFQSFSIPTEGDNDADATTHEVAAKSAPYKSNQTITATVDKGGKVSIGGKVVPSTPTGNTPAFAKLMPFGKSKGIALGELDTAALKSTIEWCETKDAEKFHDLIEACAEVIVSRGTSTPGTGMEPADFDVKEWSKKVAAENSDGLAF